MTLTIGRADLRDADRRKYARRGRAITLGGTYRPGTEGDVHAAQAAADNLIALTEDEALRNQGHPISWSDVPSVKGYYVINNAAVEETESFDDTGGFRWSVTAELLPQSAFPPVELIGYAADRNTSEHGVTGIKGSFWLPETYEWQRTGGNLNSLYREEGEFGTVRGERIASTLAQQGGRGAFGIDADNYFDAACRIEIDRANTGSTWHLHQGRQLPRVAVDDPSTIRLSNGFIRFTFEADGDMVIEVYDGSNWDTMGDMNLSNRFLGPTYLVRNPATPVIVRNDPEEVIVNYATPHTGDDKHERESRFLAVALRRGELFVTLTEDTIPNFRFGFKNTTACTSSTGILYQTAATSGHRIVFGCIHDIDTVDTSNGHLTSNLPGPAGYGFEAFIGVNPDWDDLNADADIGDIREQWWSYVGLTQYVAAT